MTIEDVRTCPATLEDVTSQILRTATTPAQAVAATFLFLNTRQVIRFDALNLIQKLGRIPVDDDDSRPSLHGSDH